MQWGQQPTLTPAYAVGADPPNPYKAIKTVRLSPHGGVKRNRLLVEMMRDKYGLKFDIDQSKSSYNGM